MCFHVYVGMSLLVLISKLSAVRADGILVPLLLRLARECLWPLGVRGLARHRGWGCAAKGKRELGRARGIAR